MLWRVIWHSHNCTACPCLPQPHKQGQHCNPIKCTLCCCLCLHTRASSTMKRRLQEKLVLLVKAQHNALSQGSAPGSTAAAAGSSSVAWTFPHTPHKSGETMRQAAERALKEAIGLSQVNTHPSQPLIRRATGLFVCLYCC